MTPLTHPVSPFISNQPYFHTVSAYHLHNQTALRFVKLVLDVTFAALHSCIFISHITQAAFEYREKRLVESMLWYGMTSSGPLYLVIQLACKACFYIVRSLTRPGLRNIEIVLLKEDILIKWKGSICRFRWIQRSKDKLEIVWLAIFTRASITDIAPYSIRASLQGNHLAEFSKAKYSIMDANNAFKWKRKIENTHWDLRMPAYFLVVTVDSWMAVAQRTRLGFTSSAFCPSTTTSLWNWTDQQNYLTSKRTEYEIT